MGKVYVVGLGPGADRQMTLEAAAAVERCEVIVGYTVYVDLVKDQYPEKLFLTTPMTQEVKRCQMAFKEAQKGKDVAMICSGDAGVYGMAGLMYETGKDYPQIDIEIVPGITAANGGAAVLGAPLMLSLIHISMTKISMSFIWIICSLRSERKHFPKFLQRDLKKLQEAKK